MKPNKECMKDVLNYICECTKIEVDKYSFNNIKLDNTNLSTLIESMKNTTAYSAEEIAYNFLQCYYDGYVNANISFNGPSIITSPKSDIIGVTLKGVDFIGENRL